jgi:hypothetical protein
LTKLLKFPMKLHTLVNEYFGWGTKHAKHLIYKCTSSSFTTIEKCLIIIKTYWFVTLSNSMGHQNPNSTNNRTPWWATMIYEVYVQWRMSTCRYTPPIKKWTLEPIITSFNINIMLGINYKSFGPQNDPTLY